MVTEDDIPPTAALLFVITCILIGMATTFFLVPRIPIPYTAMLLVFGLAIGLLQSANPQTEAFTETLVLWMGIDPHLLLLIFLPTIGFSAAIDQEPHLLRKNWSQILILAWPGVVVNFLLLALCAKYFFPYNWTWPQSLLFGAMLSATDPVAVVAVLQELGADEKLANVIDGESLVNDGSAFVIFLVLQQFVQGASLTPGQIVVLFIRLALLGAAVGLAFALITSAWLSQIFNDPGLEIIMTFGAAYACYYVAEEFLGASGLLAVVVMGFSMSIMGGRQITNRIKVEMHAFWRALGWVANTVLFLWVGIALGLVIPPKPSGAAVQMQIDFSSFLSAADIGYAVVLYLWLLVSRVVAIGLFYPLLSSGKCGYAVTWKTAIVMIWAGLRGAVGVAMSLFILFDPLITDHNYKAHCVFFMVLMAFATVLINGSTTKYLLQALGMLNMTPEQVQVLEHVLQEVDGIRDRKLDHIQDSPVLGRANPAVVHTWTAIDARSTLASANRKLRRMRAMSEARGRPKHAAVVKAAAEAAVSGKGWDELVAEHRRRLLHVVRASYGDLYQHYEIGTAEISLLSEVTDRALDDINNPPKSVSNHKRQHRPTSRHHPDVELGSKVPDEHVTGGLTDWQGLKARLETLGWANRIDHMFAASCIPKNLLNTTHEQQAAAKLILLDAFVDAHNAAQEVITTHLVQLGHGSSTEPVDKAHHTTVDDVEKPPTASSNTEWHRCTALSDVAQARGATVSSPAGGGAGASAASLSDDDQEVKAAQTVLQESRAEVDAAIQYAQQVVVPDHPRLASLLMSRFVAVRVLEDQRSFLEGIEAAGLIKGEEVNDVQRRVNRRLELLQHAHHWHLPPKVSTTDETVSCYEGNEPDAVSATKRAAAAATETAAPAGADRAAQHHQAQTPAASYLATLRQRAAKRWL